MELILGSFSCSTPIGANLPAAWNYGAVERALRDAGSREGADIFDIAVGNVFDSTQEAYEFYNMYSWEKGFGIRYGRSHVTSGGQRRRQDIICSCQGHDQSNESRTVRCGCPAMVRLVRNDDDAWVVSRFVPEHSHPLSVSCGEKRQWNSHSRIDEMTRDLVRHLRLNNVQISRVCSIIGGMHSSNSYVPFSRQSIRSLCARLSQESIVGDMTKTIEKFNELKENDPGLVVKMQLDGSQRVKSLFWCHGSGRLNYSYFGDVVTFDTTYRTNLYNLPFSLFVGVNNHFQTTFFGAVLLTEETIKAFSWAFKIFVEAMGGRSPKTILTDQCKGMKAAIKDALPATRHRWCKWHVLRKAKESLGSIYSKNTDFKRDLRELLDEIVSIEEFESRWADLVATHHLEDNEFLSNAYEKRTMWAKPFFTDTFCAGMTSTQRSESANHMLKTYIPRSAPMHLFVSQYDRMIADREADEGKEEHATKQTRRVLKLGFPIELHAAKFFTRTMFDKFSQELYRSNAFGCYEVTANHSYRVVLMSRAGYYDHGKTEYMVTVSADGFQYYCECKKFEHCGLPCRHVLKVLVHNLASEIPPGLLCTRWGREAKMTGRASAAERSVPSNRRAESATLHAVVYAASMELVRMCSSSRHHTEIALDYITRAKEAVVASTVIPHLVHATTPKPEQPTPLADGSVVDDREETASLDKRFVAAPPRVRSRGRPKQSRIKSPIEVKKKVSKKRRASSQLTDESRNVKACIKPGGKDKPGGKSGSKCRICGSNAHYAVKCDRNQVAGPRGIGLRKCSICGVAGHNRNSCSRKKKAD
uniref:Uncharacterized protein n=1 Tax=Avena sativa TaxID=4498 RepID=A0ACD5UC92_AVESA